MKRKLFYALFILLSAWGEAHAEESPVTVRFYDAELPLLTNRKENIVGEIIVTSPSDGEVLEEIALVQHGISPRYGKSVRVFYSGTSSVLCSRTPSQAIHEGVRNQGGSQLFYCHPAYSIQKDENTAWGERMTFRIGTPLVKGDNYFWVSMEVKPDIPLDTRFTWEVREVRVTGENIPVRQVKEKAVIHRLGYGLRQSGDDGVQAYRIPGLVTTNRGTLIAVYDARHQTFIDLQEDIDIGMSRSVNGGKSWEPMRIILDMGEYKGLPRSQNGVGDPAVLVDKRTNTIWVSAVWVHGLSNARAWASVRPGMTPEEGTGQLLLVKSTDDGLTWSAPVNITSQVKTEDMTMLLQGPGRGIAMRDGTLVFPVQYKSVKNNGRGEITIIYSKDHGLTWKRANPVSAGEVLSEPQVAEVAPGRLMVNARTSAPYRFVAVTADLGNSWEKHPSSGKALVEPGCMGSLLRIGKTENIIGKDILLFSNPDCQAGRPSMASRRNITVKASLDGGLSWKPEYRINLDEEQGWGYSCLTLVDEETIGILYEGSTAQMVFQTIQLKELIK